MGTQTRRTLTLTAVVIAVVAVISLVTDEVRGPFDGRWELTALEVAGSPLELVEFSGTTGAEGPAVLELSRQPSGARLDAYGCNSLTDARFMVDGDRFVLSDGGITALGCEPAEATFEEMFFDALRLADRIHIDDSGHLALTGPLTRLEFAPAA